MAIDLIISVDDMKSVCGLSSSMDGNYLTSYIDQATDLATTNVLGTALTQKLISDNNNSTLTGVYEEMWNSAKCSVKKMVAWQAYQLCLPRMLFKIGAETISVGDTDDVTSIDSSDLAVLTRQADASRVMYENGVKNYLSTNYSSIPELVDSTPNYKPADTTHSDTSQGLSFTPNITYSNF